MARLIKKEINIKVGRYNFDFLLHYPIVMIYGNSGTGKTLFYNKLNTYCAANGIDDYVFINYLATPSTVDALLKVKNKIIVIDNADVVMNKDIDFYSNSNNQFIIFGRVTSNYTLDRRQLATIVESQPYHFSLLYSQVLNQRSESIESLLADAVKNGYSITSIPTVNKVNCTLISKSDTDHIIYIPDDVTNLNGLSFIFTQHIKNLQGHINVIGGKGLIDINNMFSECQAKSLDLSSFDTSNVKFMNYMFYKCEVQSLDLSSFDTSNVKYMGYMFCDCQVQSLDLSSFDTSKVTDMRSMFFDCQAQSLDLSSFDTSNVTDMVNMFFDCQAQSLDLSSFNTSNVTTMYGMFARCEAQSLDLSSFDTSNVTNMCAMFKRCEVQSLDLSSFDTSNVKDMSNMFDECEAQSIDLSSFDTSNVTNMEYMFYDCKAQILATDPKILEECKNLK